MNDCDDGMGNRKLHLIKSNKLSELKHNELIIFL